MAMGKKLICVFITFCPSAAEIGIYIATRITCSKECLVPIGAETAVGAGYLVALPLLLL